MHMDLSTLDEITSSGFDFFQIYTLVCFFFNIFRKLLGKIESNKINYNQLGTPNKQLLWCKITLGRNNI
jgi:hypothetical protein